jgi:hypothetical protein
MDLSNIRLLSSAEGPSFSQGCRGYLGGDAPYGVPATSGYVVTFSWDLKEVCLNARFRDFFPGHNRLLLYLSTLEAPQFFIDGSCYRQCSPDMERILIFRIREIVCLDILRLHSEIEIFRFPPGRDIVEKPKSLSGSEETRRIFAGCPRTPRAWRLYDSIDSRFELSVLMQRLTVSLPSLLWNYRIFVVDSLVGGFVAG